MRFEIHRCRDQKFGRAKAAERTLLKLNYASMTLVRRGILHRSLVLSGHMTADQAAGGCAQETMAAGIVPRNAADNRSLDAAFGVSRDRRGREGQRQGKSRDQCFHIRDSVRFANPRRAISFRRGCGASR
jgi:hypothetical protein